MITGGAALRHYRLPAPQCDHIDVLVPLQARRQGTADVRLHRTARLPELVDLLPTAIRAGPPGGG